MEEIRNAPCCNGEDRISRLPDSLIHHILSFNDTKYAVQTCVLSKRWMDIWKSLPILKFNRSSFSEDKKNSFIMFVDMVFICHKDFDIQNFRVIWKKSAYDSSVAVNVNRWIIQAVKYNVQEISIVITQCHDSPFEIPPHLLNCKSLRKLVMQVLGKGKYADIVLPRSMSLPQLKVLYLIGLSISNVELSKRLLSSCPVLERLHIVDCDIKTDNRRNLIVDSLSLKEFQYNHHVRFPLLQNDTMANTLKLCAPNLEVFSCESFMLQDYSLENCSPLSRVHFFMKLKGEGEGENENAEAYSELPSEEKEVYAKRMTKFLRAVSMVKSMRLSPGFLEALSQAPDLLVYQPPRLCNLRYLTLGMWSTRGCFRAIAYLLKNSPHITRLFLESKESNLADVGDDWDAGMSSPGMLSHLKYVQIKEAEGSDNELKFLGFLFKNAMVLKNVILNPRSTTTIDERFRCRLRALPRASSSSMNMGWAATESVRIS